MTLDQKLVDLSKVVAGNEQLAAKIHRLTLAEKEMLLAAVETKMKAAVEKEQLAAKIHQLKLAEKEMMLVAAEKKMKAAVEKEQLAAKAHLLKKAKIEMMLVEAKKKTAARTLAPNAEVETVNARESEVEHAEEVSVGDSTSDSPPPPSVNNPFESEEEETAISIPVTNDSPSPPSVNSPLESEEEEKTIPIPAYVPVDNPYEVLRAHASLFTANTVPESKDVPQEPQERHDEGYESCSSDWHIVEKRGSRRKSKRTAERNAQHEAIQDKPSHLPEPTVDAPPDKAITSPRREASQALILSDSIPKEPQHLVLPEEDASKTTSTLPDENIATTRYETIQALTSAIDIPKEPQLLLLPEEDASKTTSALSDDNIATTRSEYFQALTSATDAPNEFLSGAPSKEEESQTASAPAEEDLNDTCGPIQDVVVDTPGQFASQSNLFAGPYAQDFDGVVFASKGLQAPSTPVDSPKSSTIPDVVPDTSRRCRPRKTRPHKGFLNRGIMVNKHINLWY
jgi:hypothetical protein